jgi:hypothetical protein
LQINPQSLSTRPKNRTTVEVAIPIQRCLSGRLCPAVHRTALSVQS